MENIKITSWNGKKIVKTLKKGILLTTMTACLAIGLTGCGKNDEYIISMTQYQPTTEYSESFNSILTTVTDEDLIKLSSDTKSVYLHSDFYVNDLSSIPVICPELETLSIINCPAIDSLDFIYNLTNLKKVTIKECPYVTQELIDYFDSKGIQHNLTSEDVKLTEKIDQIIAKIITDDMEDSEKIQAITSYVINNYSYSIRMEKESNERPLSTMINTGQGVCAGYAYLTNALLTKAGVTSYEITNDDHAWNCIEMDGKYYYVDTTNIKQPLWPAKLLLDKFNIGLFYMSDPGGNAMSAMSDYNDDEVIIPQSLIEAIEKGEDTKTLIEKYQGSVPTQIICGLTTILGISGGVKLASAISDARYYRKRQRRR